MADIVGVIILISVIVSLVTVMIFGFMLEKLKFNPLTFLCILVPGLNCFYLGFLLIAMCIKAFNVSRKTWNIWFSETFSL